MRVVFVGPSLPEARDVAGPDICVRPPACQGDVMQAVEDGATAIGLIDGQFEFVAPVWHKELLFALHSGIEVFGSSSMGALRAAECAAFGMIGVGKIFDEYASGKRIDDADVALLHGPAEVRYGAVTIPLVNVDATLANAVALGLLSEDQAGELSLAAQKIFFKDRTWQRITEQSDMDWSEIGPSIKRGWKDQKREDAFSLINQMMCGDEKTRFASDWTFNATPLWRELYS